MRSNVAAVVAVFGLLACGDGQAGSDYRGEPMMSMKGVVRSSSVALSMDLVPALMFEPKLEDIYAEAATTFFVQGEVEGTFPSSFTMRVYDAPDPETLDAWLPGEPAMAQANIVALDPEHPAWLRLETTYDDEGQIETLCADDGECLMSNYVACQQALDDGEPAAWPCSQEFPDEVPWETYGYSLRHGVVYLDSEAAAGGVLSRLFAGGAAIGAGYHAVEFTDPAETMTDDQLGNYYGCQSDAQERAVAELNEAHGTDFTVGNLGPIHQDFELLSDYTPLYYRALADMGCSLGHQIVPTSEAPVELEFTDQPGQVAF